jgi:hypothetical protein
MDVELLTGEETEALTKEVVHQLPETVVRLKKLLRESAAERALSRAKTLLEYIRASLLRRLISHWLNGLIVP